MGYPRMLERYFMKMTLVAYMLLYFAHSWFSVKFCGMVIEFYFRSGGFEWWERSSSYPARLHKLISSTTDTFQTDMLIFNLQSWAVLILTGF